MNKVLSVVLLYYVIVLNHTLYFRDSRSVADCFLTSVGYLSEAYFKNFDWLLPMYLNIIIGKARENHHSVQDF